MFVHLMSHVAVYKRTCWIVLACLKYVVVLIGHHHWYMHTMYNFYKKVVGDNYQGIKIKI